MTEDLRRLRDILTVTIDKVISVCEQRNEEFPKLDQPVQASELSPYGIRNDPEVVDAIAVAVAAASQLVVTLQSPAVSITTLNAKALIAGGVSAVERLHVAEIIRNAGDRGMHISEIVKHNGTDADKLSRVLRHLATNHIFKEVAPDVFAHNMLSSLLDTGKSLDEIRGDPDAKFDNTNGMAAWASLFADDDAKSGVYIDEALTDPIFAHSQEPTQTSIQKAYRFEGPFWEWMDRPENAWRLRRFNVAMKGASNLHPPAAILTSYDWTSLPKGAVVVDVGSGLGHVSLEISKIRPDLTFVLEDRPSVIDDAKIHWTRNVPEVVAGGNVHFFGMDFFKAQPVLPAAPDVFLLRMIIHDHSDKYAIKLLQSLRKAAEPGTRLLIVDTIVEYACEDPNEFEYSATGYERAKVPAPLLPNLGVASSFAYDLDMIMLNLVNAKERTLPGWSYIFAASRWKLSSVRKSKAVKSPFQLLIAEPI